MPLSDRAYSKRDPANMWMVSGITGALFSVLCCLTPLALLGLSAIGLGYMTGYIDSVALFIFTVSLGLIGYGLFRKTCYRKPKS